MSPYPLINKITVYVGFWPAKSAVVVAHQGTDPLRLYVYHVLLGRAFRVDAL